MLPYGSTIEHTLNDVTRIIRPDGTEIGWVNDAEAGTFLAPSGILTNTANVIIIPEASYINSTAVDRVTVKNASSGKIDESQETIMTILYPDLARSSQPKNPPHTPSDAPSYVEWGEMSRSSMSNFQSFNTSWTIPTDPKYASMTDRTDLPQRTQASVWNGIQSGTNIIQGVANWNWYYKGSSDSYRNFDGKWSWAVYGKDSTHDLTFLTEPKSISAGNNVWANYTLFSVDTNTNTYTWHIDSSQSLSTLQWTTADLSRTNGELDVALEAYLKAGSDQKSTVWDTKYLPKNTKFTDFQIKDTSGTTITPSFTGEKNSDWTSHISTLDVVITSNPCTITLKF
jgi:hypothetical protein